ncbi:putative formate dehydrogenase, gamma subunit [Methylococcus capsulatus str. Bath]|jgi:formate dehydrogenase subunit gamma|uniref:Putative formate dehydrogenase, gamma subunit n=1 Tax=Methylococcus capsulatus (strain ATCC 33009 / NCIMB 11132 / Bath) TaxID=243233 RepID=Q609M5_METCA|nr:formate dehydrogenase subunit gamma [Methylococcus capsulatus]AAU92708.1 putative formate dehydrogenase, gamma subunit [Methylococcus capsulatus str. Bath]
MSNDRNPSRIERYSPAERLNHWITALTFLLLSCSGLALFHPALFWFTQFFGGPTWTRILHPYVGVVMFASFGALAFKFWHHNLLTRNDIVWLRRIADVVRNREDRLPEVDRYNAGQKMLFWTMIATIPALLLTGIVIWRPWFAPYFDIGVIRLALLLHAFCAFIMIAGIIVHVYAALWIKGTIGAMVRGSVSRAWARKHHPGWYRRVTGGG